MTWLALPWVFVRRDASIARSYPLPFVLQVLATAGILLVVNRVGLLVDPDRSADPAMQAGFYSYVLVGVVVLQLVTAAIVSFSAQLREEQSTGTFEALLSTPTPPAVTVLCLAGYPLLRGLVASGVLVAGGVATGAHLDVTPASGLAAVLCLAGLVFLGAAAGVLVAAFLVVYKRGGGLTGWLVTLMAFVSGIYFPVSQLPGVGRSLAEAVPFTWGITALRSQVLLGHPDTTRALATLLAGCVLLVAALWIFARALDAARRRGTLGFY